MLFGLRVYSRCDVTILLIHPTFARCVWLVTHPRAPLYPVLPVVAVYYVTALVTLHAVDLVATFTPHPILYHAVVYLR